VWQAIRDWFRSDRDEAVTSRYDVRSTGVSVDLAAPFVLNRALAADALGEGGAAAVEAAEPMFSDEATPEIDEYELHEFLAADHDPAPADPAFREALRDQLWALVQDGVITGPKIH